MNAGSGKLRSDGSGSVQVVRDKVWTSVGQLQLQLLDSRGEPFGKRRGSTSKREAITVLEVERGQWSSHRSGADDDSCPPALPTRAAASALGPRPATACVFAAGAGGVLAMLVFPVPGANLAPRALVHSSLVHFGPLWLPLVISSVALWCPCGLLSWLFPKKPIPKKPIPKKPEWSLSGPK
ncbi:hypothetical protein FPQ18DRAFT_379944 [Pyronema domesticum]|nr:hypothetical protein FPQ18DRAFT_379944 [Pyronema domesticum]